MAAEFDLPEPWRGRGWRLKIYDKERLEPPHITLMFKAMRWRFGLRECAFIDREPDPGMVDSNLVTYMIHNIHNYARAWDLLYPHNKVMSHG